LICLKEQEESKLGFGHFEMPTMKEVMRGIKQVPNTPTKSNAKSLLLNGLVRINADSTTLAFTEENWYSSMCED
jgi:hypothetical protein